MVLSSWLLQTTVRCHKLVSTFSLRSKLVCQRSLFSLTRWTLQTLNSLSSLKWTFVNFLQRTASMKTLQSSRVQLQKRSKAIKNLKTQLWSSLQHLIATFQNQFVTSTSHSLCLLRTFSQSRVVEQLRLVVSNKVLLS